MTACNCDLLHLCPLGCLADHENDEEPTVIEEQKNRAALDGLLDTFAAANGARPECICTYVEIGRRLTQQVLNPDCQAHGPEDPPLVEKDRDFL